MSETNQPTNQPTDQQPPESGPRLVNGLTPEQRAERHRNADKLCWRSVRYHLGAAALLVIAYCNYCYHQNDISLGYQIFEYTCLIIALALYIAAWVFMLKARVNYRESKFAGVLLAIYIGIAAWLLQTVILAIAFSLLLPDCSHFPG